jgi:D-Tyr-tRNAtyr deacylase
MTAGFRERGIDAVEGVFGAMMDVDLVNEGPVTLVLDFAGGRIR